MDFVNELSYLRQNMVTSDHFSADNLAHIQLGRVAFFLVQMDRKAHLYLNS